MSDEELMHYGVKGMRWGVRRERPDTPKISRRENRRLNREARDKFRQDKAQKILDTAMKDGSKVMVMGRFNQEAYPTIMSGKEFVTAISKGSSFDVDTIEVIARKNRSGDYDDVEAIGKYKKQDFRKQTKTG